MPERLDWDDAEALAQILFERFPDTDPLSVHPAELFRWVSEIPEFTAREDSGGAGEQISAHLETIRRAWADEREDHVA